jgi:hypothetical protein
MDVMCSSTRWSSALRRFKSSAIKEIARGLKVDILRFRACPNFARWNGELLSPLAYVDNLNRHDAKARCDPSRGSSELEVLMADQAI